MTAALPVAAYGAVFVLVVLLVSRRAAREVRAWSERCLDWLAAAIACGREEGFEWERRYAVEQFEASRFSLRVCRALALPWLLVSKGILR